MVSEIKPVYLHADKFTVDDIKRRKWSHAYVYQEGYKYLCGRSQTNDLIKEKEDEIKQLGKAMVKLQHIITMRGNQNE
jgi:hypothetical protein